MRKLIALLFLLVVVSPTFSEIKWHTQEELKDPDLEGFTAWASCDTEAEVKKIAKIKLDLDYYFEEYYTFEKPADRNGYEILIKERLILIYKLTENSPVIECYVVYK